MQYNSSRPPLESPGQLAVFGIAAWLIGVVIQPLVILVPLGLLLLIGAGVAYALRPRQHSMYWRGRQIDLSDHESSTERFYRSIFRR